MSKSSDYDSLVYATSTAGIALRDDLADTHISAIVCIMAAESYWSGKRLYWDPQRQEILDQPV